MFNSIRPPKLSFANLTALIALFVALGGSAYAVSKDEIRSRHIADGAVKSKDLRDGNVKSRDVKDGDLTGADLAAGSLGSAQIRIRCGADRVAADGLCYDAAPHARVRSVFSAAGRCEAERGRLPTPLQFRAAEWALEVQPQQHYWTDSVYYDDGVLRSIVIAGDGGVAVDDPDQEYGFSCVYEPFSG